MTDQRFDVRPATLSQGDFRGLRKTWWLSSFVALVVPVALDASALAVPIKSPDSDRTASAAAPPAPPPSGSAAEKPRPPSAGHLSSMFPVDYWDPEKSVPSAKQRDNSPLEFGYFLQDLLEEAELARKNNDLPAVIRFYRAVAKAVPDNAKGWSKLCEAYELAGDRQRAMKACEYALQRPAVELQDYIRYANLILAKEGALLPAETSELNSVLAHLEKQGSYGFLVNELRCRLGVKMKDVAILEACTQELARLSPDDPRTVVFQWSLAVQKGQRAEAQRLIDRAVKAGVVLENVERMRQLTATAGGRNGIAMKLAIATGVLVLIAAAALLAFKRRTLNQSFPAR